MKPTRALLRTLPFVLLLTLSASAMERQPGADYRARRVKLSQQTSGGTIVLFAATEEEGPNAIYGYRQDENFFYLSGWSEPGAALLIAPATPATDSAPARPYTEVLFLPARNRTQERWTGPKLTADDPKAAEKTGFDRVANLDQLRDELVRVLPQPRAAVYSDLAGWDRSSPATMPLMWQRRANAFPNYVSFEDVKPLVNRLRLLKDAGEIALIRKATDASVAAHFAAMRDMRPQITEREISALMQYEFGKRGCERPAYSPIVGSGFYSTVLHYSENFNTIADGDVVVLDVAGEYSMYASDITRTLPANGKFTARQREIYDIVLGAQQAAMDAFVAGKSTLGRGSNSLHRVAAEYINTHGKDLKGESLGKYFIHGLSHYVGLNVHDPGDTSAPLQPGAVFTIEPGIYIPDEKLGVRIEDIFLVDADGKLVNLSGALPRSAADVERAMAAGKARR